MPLFKTYQYLPPGPDHVLLAAGQLRNPILFPRFPPGEKDPSLGGGGGGGGGSAAAAASERDGFRAACPRPDRCVFHGNPQSQLMKQDFSRQAC